MTTFYLFALGTMAYSRFCVRNEIGTICVSPVAGNLAGKGIVFQMLAYKFHYAYYIRVYLHD